MESKKKSKKEKKEDDPYLKKCTKTLIKFEKLFKKAQIIDDFFKFIFFFITPCMESKI